MMARMEKAQKQVFARKIFFIPVLLLVLFAFIPAAAGIKIEEEAEKLSKALLAEESILLSQADATEKTEENAYKIQALVFKKLLDRSSDTVAGYKAGLTTPAQIERFKAPAPVSAPLLKSGLIELADLEKPFTLKRFPGIMLEVEFAFKTAVPIEAPVKDEEDLKKRIQSVHPSIEVPQLNFADMANLEFFDLTAAGVGSKKFVVGPAQSTQLDLDVMQVSLSRDGTVVNEGKGSDAWGGQWKALLWLVNNVVAHNGRIEAGQYLMTGALGKMLPAQPGHYTAAFPFATLTFEVVE